MFTNNFKKMFLRYACGAWPKNNIFLRYVHKYI